MKLMKQAMFCSCGLWNVAVDMNASRRKTEATEALIIRTECTIKKRLPERVIQKYEGHRRSL